MCRWLSTIGVGVFVLMLQGCVPAWQCTSPTVNGRVLDKETGEPNEGAEASVVEHPKARAVSDSSGTFTIKRRSGLTIMVPLGDCIFHGILVVEKDGYTRQSTEFGAWPVEGPVDLTIELEPHTQGQPDSEGKQPN